MSFVDIQADILFSHLISLKESCKLVEGQMIEGVGKH
jgi:hypothetical protein